MKSRPTEVTIAPIRLPESTSSRQTEDEFFRSDVIPASKPTASDADASAATSPETTPAEPHAEVVEVTTEPTGIGQPREIRLDPRDEVVVITEQVVADEGVAPITRRTLEPQATEPQQTPKAPRARKGKPTRSEPRDFLVSYEGVFVGVYRAPRRVTNRTAFGIVGRELQRKLGEHFDPRSLELFKPVRLQIDRPESFEEFSHGSFQWLLDDSDDE